MQHFNALFTALSRQNEYTLRAGILTYVNIRFYDGCW